MKSTSPFGELDRFRKKKQPASKFIKSMGALLAGFAAAAIPLHFLLRNELRGAPKDFHALGWPIRLIQVLFQRRIIKWIDVEGLENLPQGSYILASNHGYKSGVDGFVLGHLLVTRGGRVPRILITGESRNWMVSMERRVLHHYGIALLVPDRTGVPMAEHHGLTDITARYLRENDRHSVIIFPAGRASMEPLQQLETWSTGTIVIAKKSGCPIVPVAIGGLPIHCTAENLLLAALHDGQPIPFHIYVRIGKPIFPSEEVPEALDEVRSAVSGLMEGIPGLQHESQQHESQQHESQQHESQQHDAAASDSSSPGAEPVLRNS